MLIFQVTSLAANPALEANIQNTYPSAHLRFAPNVWFVADQSVTTREVTEKLGVIPGSQFSGIVIVKVESYFGLASNSVWEWFKVKSVGI